MSLIVLGLILWCPALIVCNPEQQQSAANGASDGKSVPVVTRTVHQADFGNEWQANVQSANKFNDKVESQALVEGVLDRFEVRPNTIIKTGESRAIGAKYINESQLLSKEDCMIWCWAISSCNLAVYEEKTRGSCYLFDCGSTEDFRCKFTQHGYYTSAVLKQNRQAYELKQWSSQSKQEDELVSLRQQQPQQQTKQPELMPQPSAVVRPQQPPPPGQAATSNIQASIANSSQQQHPLVIAPGPPTPAALPSSLNAPTAMSANYLPFRNARPNYQPSSNAPVRCHDYQFACRNGTECIAVYNVCDGIPQCPDGSDEAAELRCPDRGAPIMQQQLPTPTPPGLNPVRINTVPSRALAGGPQSVYVDTGARVDGPQRPQVVSKPSQASMYKYPKEPDAPDQAVVDLNTNKALGPNQQQTQPMVGGQAAPVDHSFGHKYSSFVPANKGFDKLPPAGGYYKQFQPWSNQGFYPGSPAEYYAQDGRGPVVSNGYGPGDVDYEAQIQNSPIFWPLPDGSPRIDQRQIGGMRPPQPAGVGFVAHNRKEQQQWLQQQQQGGLDYPGAGGLYAQRPPPNVDMYGQQPPNVAQSRPGSGPKSQTAGLPVKSVDSQPSAITEKPVVKPAISYSRLAADSRPAFAASLAISHLRDSNPGGRDTNSAVIALTLGLCITAMLVGLVGCRMKSIKRRIARRGGRSLTHDADYLVNGMYL